MFSCLSSFLCSVSFKFSLVDSFLYPTSISFTRHSCVDFGQFFTHTCAYEVTPGPILIDHQTTTWSIPLALAPRGAICSAGMAMLGSTLQPTSLHTTFLQNFPFFQFFSLY